MISIYSIQNKLKNKLFKDAIKDCDKIISKNKNNIAALELKCLALNAIKEKDLLIKSLKEILQINQRNIFANLNLARTIKREDLETIKFYYNQAIKFSDDNVDIINEYGVFLASCGQHQEAILCFNKILFYDSKNSSALFNVGFAYQQDGQSFQSIQFLEKCLPLHSNKVMVLNVLALSYYYEKNAKKAKELYLKALEIDDKNLETILNLSILEQNLGHFDSSKNFLRKAMKIKPGDGEVHRTFTLIHKYKSSQDEHLILMKKIYDKGKNITFYKSFNFALGKAYDDLKDYKLAARHFVKGNNLRRAEFANYKFENEMLVFDKFKKIFNKNFYDRFNNSKLNLGKGLIFIVGMPRSGTSLIEQILSSNKNVHGHGELNFFSEAVEKFLPYKSIDEFEKIIPIKLNNDLLKSIGEYYLDKIEKLNVENKKFQIDKNPINFRLVPLILSALPNSKIIHCSRDPRDNCLSLYKNYFSQFVMPWCYDQDELSKYYKSYSSLMEYYHYFNENRIITVDYDNLVNNFEDHVKSLIKKVDLEWNDEYLKFYENKRLVTTASVSQVRQKIFKTSSKGWENYKDYFKNLFENLN